MSTNLNLQSLSENLDAIVEKYNCIDFIENDPIQIPHLFTKKEDIEIAGFLTATIAWGKRVMIINNAKKMMNLMDNDPHKFVINHRSSDLKRFDGFVHRTFNALDLKTFITSLKNIYINYGGLEQLFKENHRDSNVMNTISRCQNVFFGIPHSMRTQKHFANPGRGSAAKRINMWLRWMCRRDSNGVDFGIWDAIPPSHLSCPLDVHSGRVARKLHLLHRKQNDAKAVKELDNALREMDSRDPVKYDFALFGLGVEGVL